MQNEDFGYDGCDLDIHELEGFIVSQEPPNILEVQKNEKDGKLMITITRESLSKWLEPDNSVLLQ
jgi:hypothetical protein